MAAGEGDASRVEGMTPNRVVPEASTADPAPSAPVPASSSSVAGASSSSSSSIDAFARTVQDSLMLGQRHRFWETQPVGQFRDLGDPSVREGPIEPPIPLSEVKSEPYALPAAYDWSTCDISDDVVATDQVLEGVEGCSSMFMWLCIRCELCLYSPSSFFLHS